MTTMAQVNRRPVEQMARDHTATAIEVIATVMADPFAEDRDRLRAAQEMLDRGHGKPVNTTVQVPSARAAAALLASMSDEELMLVLQQAPLPRLAAPIDAEFVDVTPDPLLG
jgi:hypothetical protein